MVTTGITTYRPGMTPLRARSISLPLLGVSNLSAFLDPPLVMFPDAGSSLTPLLFRPSSSLSLEYTGSLATLSLPLASCL